jgi:hypothetical protein
VNKNKNQALRLKHLAELKTVQYQMRYLKGLTKINQDQILNLQKKEAQLLHSQ